MLGLGVGNMSDWIFYRANFPSRGLGDNLDRTEFWPPPPTYLCQEIQAVFRPVPTDIPKVGGCHSLEWGRTSEIFPVSGLDSTSGNRSFSGLRRFGSAMATSVSTCLAGWANFCPSPCPEKARETPASGRGPNIMPQATHVLGKAGHHGSSGEQAIASSSEIPASSRLRGCGGVPANLRSFGPPRLGSATARSATPRRRECFFSQLVPGDTISQRLVVNFRRDPTVPRAGVHVQ